MTTREQLAATARGNGWVPGKATWWRVDQWVRDSQRIIIQFTESGRVSQASLIGDNVQTDAVYQSNRNYRDKVAKVASWLAR